MVPEDISQGTREIRANIEGIYLDKLYVVMSYQRNRALQILVKRYKYRNAFDISIVLGHLMKTYLRTQGINKRAYRIVPVPLHWRRLLKRGYNQSYLLAKEIGKPVKLLKRTRNTPQQALLTREERRINVIDSFLYIRRKHKRVPKRVLLIDDIASTASTMEECAKVLKKAGVKEVIGLVLGRNVY